MVKRIPLEIYYGVAGLIVVLALTRPANGPVIAPTIVYGEGNRVQRALSELGRDVAQHRPRLVRGLESGGDVDASYMLAPPRRFLS